MEKYARQAIAEGVKNAEDIVVTTDSELYRVLNLHYNRNNQIEVRLYYWLKLVEKKKHAPRLLVTTSQKQNCEIYFC